MRNVRYVSGDGISLNFALYGPDTNERLPVVCLPGLTRNSRDFHGLAQYLSHGESGRRVISFDYRGRGLSDRDPDWTRYTVPVEASDVVTGLQVLGIEEAIFVGTSRGGLISMVLAATIPGLIRGLVLNDIGPVIEGRGLAVIQSYLGRNASPLTLDEAIALQKSIHGRDFPSLTESDWKGMVEATCRERDGRYIPDHDLQLAKSMEGVDFESQPLPDLWPQFEALATIPLLVIRGVNSRLLSIDTVAQMMNRHPNARKIDVPGQGHAPFLHTGDLPQEIASFVDQVEQSRSI